MDLQLALGAVEDNVPGDVKPLWPEVTKTCMLMWRSLDYMLSNPDEAQRGLRVAITNACARGQTSSGWTMRALLKNLVASLSIIGEGIWYSFFP